MHVAPYTSSYGLYYSPSSYTPCYLSRTSLDRSTRYGSSYTRSVSNKYSRPPLPTYSTYSDTYRLNTRSLRVSPARTYRGVSDYRASVDTVEYSLRNRETSLSRELGYGSSRYSSRERSADVVNGNAEVGSSYSSRWRSGDDDRVNKDDPEENKVNVSDRIRQFERSDDEERLARRRQRLGLSPYVSDPRASRIRTETYESRFRRDKSNERDSNVNRTETYESRFRRDKSNERDSNVNRTETYESRFRRDKSNERDSNVNRTDRLNRPTDTDIGEAVKLTSHQTEEPRSIKSTEEDQEDYRSSKSVVELCRAYDANLNLTNGSPLAKTTYDPALRVGMSGGASSLPPVAKECDSDVRPESPRGHRKDSFCRAGSPVALCPSREKSPEGEDVPDGGRRESPPRRVPSPAVSLEDVTQAQKEPQDRTPVLNGAPEIVKVSVEGPDDGSSGLSSRARMRRDRINQRIAARLAAELEDDDCPSPRRRSPTGSSTGSCGAAFSESGGLVGLRNIGNTCFLNSITQCLSNTRCLLEYLVKEGYSSDINSTMSNMKGDLVRAFAFLLVDMWREGCESSRALNTGPFKAQIQRFAPVFSGYQQHDAQEFLRKLLEGLHEDVNRVLSRPKPILEDIDDGLDDQQKAMESWKRYLRYDDSRIVDMFVGQLKSSLECSVCGHCSVTFDPFWDLSLPIPSKAGQVRLSQCLELFTKEEVLDGEERPTCSRCKERRKMTKSFSMQKFPKVLVLHLKRFSPHERWRGKLTCTVEFPIDNLDLSRYASSLGSSCTYRLIGVANHSGTTYSGHYTAYCRHPYSGHWHEYNDSRVSNISLHRICSPEAYVLFYELCMSSSKL